MENAVDFPESPMRSRHLVGVPSPPGAPQTHLDCLLIADNAPGDRWAALPRHAQLRSRTDHHRGHHLQAAVRPRRPSLATAFRTSRLLYLGPPRSSGGTTITYGSFIFASELTIPRTLETDRLSLMSAARTMKIRCSAYWRDSWI
jgi:hypothetical protein